MPDVPPRSGPVMLLIMDGWGLRDEVAHNAVKLGRTPNLTAVGAEYPSASLRTSGTDVGLPKGTMGNSEVGHQNLGAGRIVWQDMMEIAQAVADGSFCENAVLLGAIKHAKEHGTRVHMFGLVSSAWIHSVDEVYFALVRLCARHDLRQDRLAIHVLTDGRDTPPNSAEQWVGELQRKLDLYDTGVIATVGGRYFAMDRDKRWERVEKGWRAIVDGVGEYTAPDALAAVQQAYARGETDEFIKPTVIVDSSGKPLATIQDGDAVISFNHRGDRPREMCHALLDAEFTGFVRRHKPQVHLSQLTDYSAGFAAPIAFPSQPLEGTLGLSASLAGLRQLRIAETEKYAHVTFFFSGRREAIFENEGRILVPSPKVATYDLQPEMSAPEVTRRVVEAIRAREYDLIILNYANGDMVGHTGVEKAAIAAVEAVDKGVGEVVAALREVKGEALITADHGNCETMWDAENNCPHTAHTTNPVPSYLFSERFKRAKLLPGRLADIAPTLSFMLGLKTTREMTGRNLIVM